MIIFLLRTAGDISIALGIILALAFTTRALIDTGHMPKSVTQAVWKFKLDKNRGLLRNLRLRWWERNGKLHARALWRQYKDRAREPVRVLRAKDSFYLVEKIDVEGIYACRTSRCTWVPQSSVELIDSWDASYRAAKELNLPRGHAATTYWPVRIAGLANAPVSLPCTSGSPFVEAAVKAARSSFGDLSASEALRPVLGCIDQIRNGSFSGELFGRDREALAAVIRVARERCNDPHAGWSAQQREALDSATAVSVTLDGLCQAGRAQGISEDKVGVYCGEMLDRASSELDLVINQTGYGTVAPELAELISA